MRDETITDERQDFYLSKAVPQGRAITNCQNFASRKMHSLLI
jgi:hypothetical protein